MIAPVNDCNANGDPDDCDIAVGYSDDVDGITVPVSVPVPIAISVPVGVRVGRAGSLPVIRVPIPEATGQKRQ